MTDREQGVYTAKDLAGMLGTTVQGILEEFYRHELPRRQDSNGYSVTAENLLWAWKDFFSEREVRPEHSFRSGTFRGGEFVEDPASRNGYGRLEIGPCAAPLLRLRSHHWFQGSAG